MMLTPQARNVTSKYATFGLIDEQYILSFKGHWRLDLC